MGKKEDATKYALGLLEKNEGLGPGQAAKMAVEALKLDPKFEDDVRSRVSGTKEWKAIKKEREEPKTTVKDKLPASTVSTTADPKTEIESRVKKEPQRVPDEVNLSLPDPLGENKTLLDVLEMKDPTRGVLKNFSPPSWIWTWFNYARAAGLNMSLESFIALCVDGYFRGRGQVQAVLDIRLMKTLTQEQLQYVHILKPIIYLGSHDTETPIMIASAKEVASAKEKEEEKQEGQEKETEEK